MQPGQPKSASIRFATEHDIPQLTQSLARAFADDGMTDWVCGPRGNESDEKRNHRTASLFEGYLRCLSLPHGMVYTVEDGAGGSLWSPPGAWQMGLTAQARMVPYFIQATGISRLLTRFLAAQKILDRHPHEPHFYLQVLGVDPSAQGRGWGAQLLKAGLAVVDKAAMPAYLETMNETNIPFYERHGFHLTGDLSLPYSGHRVWFMRRNAVTADQ